jgi:hypothetical protein
VSRQREELYDLAEKHVSENENSGRMMAIRQMLFEMRRHCFSVTGYNDAAGCLSPSEQLWIR